MINLKLEGNQVTTAEQTQATQIGIKSEDANGNCIELLDYLLSFLDTDLELNHVLAGYFSKIMLLLLSKQQKTVKKIFIIK